MNRNIYQILFCLIISLSYSIETVESTDATKSSSPSSAKAAVYIIYTEKPENEQPESYHIRTLASVLGSEKAAKEALIYSYNTAASGFSAKLTREQVAEIKKQPGVLQVVPNSSRKMP